jgi:tyrosinase
MLEDINSGSTLSRREFVTATAAVATAAVLPSGTALGQAPPKFRRMNISEPGFPTRVLDSYKKAIKKMLALPATDPRNWYRHALIHTLDCPHGNWWFLVWHRGYTGWFEQICRELSEDPEFALPYWDWTKEPKVPDAMFDDVLTPTNPAFIASFADFKAKFQDVVAQADYWKLNPDGSPNDQYGQLLGRGLRFPDDLWFDINDKNPAGGMFFDLAHARGLTRDKPDFSDDVTKKAVALPMILDALGPRDFITFASPKTLAHSSTTGFGVLENQPHNKVHNNVGGVTINIVNGQIQVTNVGGFMQGFLSPVDPIFFLHHANMDRLWDVWTRKQQGRGFPILPDGYPKTPGAPVPANSDYDLWSTEPFLFFVDAKGQPVTKTSAGDYAAIGDFNYDYQPGSGEEVVPTAVAAAPAAAPAVAQQLAARVVTPFVNQPGGASAQVILPQPLLAAGAQAPKLFAKVTVALPPLGHANDLAVVVGGEVITLSLFGHHYRMEPLTFTVPVSRPVNTLLANNALAANAPLDIRLVQGTVTGPQAGMAAHGMRKAELLSVTVEAH